MLKDYFVKRKRRKFITAMSTTLAGDYGFSSEYTEGQVKTALKKLGYSQDFEEVAVGIFCNEDIAKAFGMDEALIKKYRGYLCEHNAGIGTDGYIGSIGGDSGIGGE